MKEVDIICQYYAEYGEDEEACAKKYLENIDQQEKLSKKIKKIAIYYPVMNRGGAQRVISLQIPLYLSLDYKVVLITEEVSADDYEIPGEAGRYIVTSLKNVENGISTYRERAEQFAAIFLKEEVDIFIHHGVRQSFLLYDLLLPKLMGIYTVAVKHQVFTQGFCDVNDLFFKQLEIFKLIDQLIVLSRTEELYWKTLGIHAAYIENPFNSSLAGLQRKSDDENIVWVGRLDIHSKQYLDVLKIAGNVLKKNSQAKFLMYGSGTKSAIEELELEIKKSNLENHVFFCGYEPEVSRIYEKARIHLVTSAYEAFPMGIFESRICGIPLVMYELPYLELLKEGKGYLASANGDIQGMADHICAVLADRELENRLCVEAKESIKRFNNEMICEKWKNIFMEIEEGKSKVFEDKEYSMIFHTMHKHFSIAQKKYEALDWKSKQEKVVFHVKKGLSAGKKIAICPYGVVGKKVKKMLNEKEIYETYIVDNFLAKYDDNIVSFEEIKKMDCGNIYFVICSEQSDIKEFFYNELKKITKKENIVCYDEELGK